MPPTALSLRSRCTSAPSGSTPIGTRSTSRSERGAQATAGSSEPGSTPSADTRSGLPPPAPRGPATSCAGRSRRASCSASATSRASAVPVRGPSGPSSSSALSASTVSRAVTVDGSSARDATRVRTVVSSPSASASTTSSGGWPVRALPVSTTTSRCGRRGPAPGSPRSLCRTDSSGRSSSATAGPSPYRRAGLVASRASGWPQCGSHFTQVQAAAESAPTTTATRRSSGACHPAAWAIAARTSARTRSGGPTALTAGVVPRATVSAASSRVPQSRATSSAACRHTSSTSWSGPPVRSRCRGAGSRLGPRPTRTTRASSSRRRRSQSRAGSSVSCHSADGCGCDQASRRPWAAAAARAASRTVARCSR